MESSSQPSSGMTAAGLPVKGRSAKASTWVKSATIMSGPCRVHGPAAGRDALPGRGGSALLYPERPLPAFPPPRPSPDVRGQRSSPDQPTRGTGRNHGCRLFGCEGRECPSIRDAGWRRRESADGFLPAIRGPSTHLSHDRSEERGVGIEGVSTLKTRWAQYH